MYPKKGSLCVELSPRGLWVDGGPTGNYCILSGATGGAERLELVWRVTTRGCGVLYTQRGVVTPRDRAVFV